MHPHRIMHDLPRAERPDEVAWVHPASEESLKTVLDAPVDEDGRSEWAWLRLPNGDLMLGVFPRGGTYEAVERDAAFTREPESPEQQFGKRVACGSGYDFIPAKGGDNA